MNSFFIQDPKFLREFFSCLVFCFFLFLWGEFMKAFNVKEGRSLKNQSWPTVTLAFTFLLTSIENWLDHGEFSIGFIRVVSGCGWDPVSNVFCCYKACGPWSVPSRGCPWAVLGSSALAGPCKGFLRVVWRMQEEWWTAEKTMASFCSSS